MLAVLATWKVSRTFHRAIKVEILESPDATHWSKFE